MGLWAPVMGWIHTHTRWAQMAPALAALTHLCHIPLLGLKGELWGIVVDIQHGHQHYQLCYLGTTASQPPSSSRRCSCPPGPVLPPLPPPCIHSSLQSFIPFKAHPAAGTAEPALRSLVLAGAHKEQKVSGKVWQKGQELWGADRVGKKPAGSPERWDTHLLIFKNKCSPVSYWTDPFRHFWEYESGCQVDSAWA